MFSFLKDLLKGGRDSKALQDYTGIELRTLEEFSSGLPARYTYQEFSIPKRQAGEYRKLQAPSNELKQIQKKVLRMLTMKMSDAATGYIKGKSIVDNVKPHVAKQIVVKLDLQDFFTTITSRRIYGTFRFLGWNRKTAHILSNICTYQGVLPQGAPTSPALSNIVCLRLDKRLMQLAKSASADYTRYADDITFSLKQNDGSHQKLIALAKKIINDEKFAIQKKKKIRVLRPHHRQKITGLVVNTTIHLPRETRRKIRAMQHKQRLGLLSQSDSAKLNGYRALARMTTR